MMGWCPFAIKRPLDFQNFFAQRLGFTAKAVCLHIADGQMAGVFPTFNHSDVDKSAHFCVGKDGSIEQYVSIEDAAWANGLHWQNGQWFTPGNRLVMNPSWVGLEPGVNPNLTTISIEHEGHPGERWTDAMYAANNRLLQWIASETGLTYVAHRTLIGHFEIDTVERPNCPGPNVEYERIAADANSALVSPAISAALLAATQTTRLLPINPATALYKFARDKGLGYPQTDEFAVTFHGAQFVAQVYDVGIAYVPTNNFSDLKSVGKVDAATLPADSLERKVVETAEQARPWLPINPDAALYHFAQGQGLGFPRSDEFRFTLACANYIGQVYQFGSVCVRDGDWGNIKAVRSPDAPAAQPGGTPAGPDLGHTEPGGGTVVTPPPPIDTRGFVGVRGEDFVIDGRPFRFMGVNIRGLVHYGDRQLLGNSEEKHRTVQLDAASAMGARVVRVFLGNKFCSTDEIAARLDATLALADKRDIYLIVAFTNFYNTLGFFPKDDERFYTGGGNKLRVDFFRGGFGASYLPFVEQIVRQFRSHKRIFAWELGNELKADPFAPNLPPDAELFIQFANTVSRRIRELDRAHLITTGCISTRQIGCNWEQGQRLYGLPTLDFVTVHSYLDDPIQEDDSNGAHALGKPCIVEEAGATGNSSKIGDETRDRVPLLRQQVASSFARGMRGFMLWGLMATTQDMGDGDVRFGVDHVLHTDFDQAAGLVHEFANQMA